MRMSYVLASFLSGPSVLPCGCGYGGAVALLHEHVVEDGLGALRLVVVVQGPHSLEMRKRYMINKMICQCGHKWQCVVNKLL